MVRTPEFSTTEDVARWLLEAPDGQAAFALADEHLRMRRIPLLILGSSDGWLEAYGPSVVDVCYLDKLHVTSRALVPSLEEWLELVIPQSHRGLYWPTHVPGHNQGGLLWQGKVSRRTLEGEAIRGQALDWLEELGTSVLEAKQEDTTCEQKTRSL